VGFGKDIREPVSRRLPGTGVSHLEGQFEIFEAAQRRSRGFAFCRAASHFQKFSEASDHEVFGLFDALRKIVGPSFRLYCAVADPLEPKIRVGKILILISGITRLSSRTKSRHTSPQRTSFRTPVFQPSSDLNEIRDPSWGGQLSAMDIACVICLDIQVRAGW
jgi:hypothetical protein